MSSSHDGRLFLNGPSRPRNVQQIVEAAQEYEYNAQVPLRYWLRTAAALLKEADIYMREGDDETTYLLLFRHAHLVLAQLQAHPGATDKTIKPLLLEARREVDRNLKLLEDVLKPRINQRYEKYNALVKERAERRAAQLKQPTVTPVFDDSARLANKRKVQHLHGHENSDLAVRLAQQEFQRRAAAQDRSVQSSREAWERGDDFSGRLQDIRARIDTVPKQSQRSTQSSATEKGSEYNYPRVKSQEAQTWPARATQLEPRPMQGVPQSALLPPSLPPKPTWSNSNHTPARPDNVRESVQNDVAPVKTSIEPSYTFTPTAFLENGKPLRTVFLPPTLRTTFLRLAQKNTQANLETCGFLAGTLISNALFVSKLIIPSQVATSDTCEMTNESQLFDYVDSGADLMILGWIHTHPTQTCFMSSRDLHTHAGYQMMLPESIAIVCAPSKGDTAYGGDWGAYRLTDPPGKMAILNCNKPGVFHPHEVDNIYTDALRPGHVVEAKGLEFEIVDLRNV